MTLFDVYPLYDVTPVMAKGVHVYDDKGTEYLDLYGGHAVISIGHQHPAYIKALRKQLDNIGFYSNAVQNPLQKEVAKHLGQLSGCEAYQLFFCNSGAEANENALKLASFSTGKKRVIAFKNGFHGRTSAAVAATDNPSIVAPLNAQHLVSILSLGNMDELEEVLQLKDTCAVILECIQGVGGLDEGTTAQYQQIEVLCRKYKAKLIIDEVQSGFGRSGDFFAYQKHQITPDIITMAKGMGNGFPVGGILIHPDITPEYGMLGTTFGGNHLACTAVMAVLKAIKRERLLDQVCKMGTYFKDKAAHISEVKQIKGRGLMLGLEFPFEVAQLRKRLIYDQHIFTGGSMNKNLLRILPPLTIQPKHFDQFFEALMIEI